MKLCSKGHSNHKLSCDLGEQLNKSEGVWGIFAAGVPHPSCRSVVMLGSKQAKLKLMKPFRFSAIKVLCFSSNFYKTCKTNKPLKDLLLSGSLIFYRFSIKMEQWLIWSTGAPFFLLWLQMCRLPPKCSLLLLLKEKCVASLGTCVQKCFSFFNACLRHWSPLYLRMGGKKPTDPNQKTQFLPYILWLCKLHYLCAP